MIKCVGVVKKYAPCTQAVRQKDALLNNLRTLTPSNCIGSRKFKKYEEIGREQGIFLSSMAITPNHTTSSEPTYKERAQNLCRRHEGYIPPKCDVIKKGGGEGLPCISPYSFYILLHISYIIISLYFPYIFSYFLPNVLHISLSYFCIFSTYLRNMKHMELETWKNSESFSGGRKVANCGLFLHIFPLFLHIFPHLLVIFSYFPHIDMFHVICSTLHFILKVQNL